MSYILTKNKKIIKEYNFEYDFLNNFKEYININYYYDIYNTLSDNNKKGPIINAVNFFDKIPILPPT